MRFRTARRSRSKSRQPGTKTAKTNQARSRRRIRTSRRAPCLSIQRQETDAAVVRAALAPDYFFHDRVGACRRAISRFSIPVSVFPSTDFPRVVIGVDNGVAPIDQMLVTVTKPIEEAVNSVPGLQTVRSITSRGSAEVDLFFDWHSDMILTLQRVDAVVAQLQSELPPTAKVQTHRLTFAAFPIIGYSLTSDTVAPEHLWEIATYDIKPRLNRLDGVATVVVQGGRVPEFQITPDPARLPVAGVTVSDILDAVRRTNLIDSPGLIESDHHLVLGLVSGQVRSAEQLGQIVVKTSPAGVPIRIGDVASVAPSVAPVYTMVTANGKPSVLLNVSRQPDSNTLQVANEVHDLIQQLEPTLPKGVRLQPFYDQSLIVHDSISSVRDAVLIGIVLSSIVLVLFLRDWGTSLVAGLVIPVTLLITFIVLKVTGQSFNLMTLGGLAAAVGLVIDDAIVVLENIVLHRDLGQDRFVAIRSALRELTVPLIGSTITPIVVFLPLIAMTGVNGAFFRALAITMTVALLTSLLLALTWTPTLSLYLVRRRTQIARRRNQRSIRRRQNHRALVAEEAHFAGFFGKVVSAYEKVMRSVIKRPLILVASVVVIVVLSAVSYHFLGSDLLPEMDEGGFILDYHTPPGSSLSESNRILLHIEEMLKATPEVESTSRRTGLELGLAAVTEANRGDFTVKLNRKRSRSFDEITSDLRAQIESSEPATKVEFVQILAGHDRRSEQSARARRDPSLFAGWQVAERNRSARGRRDQQSSGSRGHPQRSRRRDQRAGRHISNQSVLRGASRLYTGRSFGRCFGDSRRRARRDTGHPG